MNIKQIVNWKIFFVLLSASVLSILAIMPYIITLQGDVLKAAPVPFPFVILLIIAQSTVLFAIFTFLGLKLSSNLGLQIPFIERFVAKKKIDFNSKATIALSILLGLSTGIVIVLLDFLFFQFGLESIFKELSVPVWQGFLASFYGGISEEIVMRLFFMSLVVWLIGNITKQRGNIIENNSVMWSAILLAAILFGIGHLPITAELMTLTPLVIFRALVLNGIGGVVFGWLFWKQGLESAMIAHFSADIILHVCLPFVLMVL